MTAPPTAIATTTPVHNPDQSYLYLRVYEDAMTFVAEITAADLERALHFG